MHLLMHLPSTTVPTVLYFELPSNLFVWVRKWLWHLTLLNLCICLSRFRDHHDLIDDHENDYYNPVHISQKKKKSPVSMTRRTTSFTQVTKYMTLFFCRSKLPFHYKHLNQNMMTLKLFVLNLRISNKHPHLHYSSEGGQADLDILSNTDAGRV